MSKHGPILLSFAVVFIVGWFFGAPMALLALVLLVLFFAANRSPLTRWSTLKGLSVVGLLFGAVWTVIGFLGGGLLVGVVMAVAVYGCYLLNRLATRKVAALNIH